MEKFSKSSQPPLVIDPSKELIDLVKSGNYNIEKLTELIEKRANVNIIDVYGRTPLQYVGIPDTENMFEFAKMLIERGADVNIQDPKYGMTLLHRAVAKNKPSPLRVVYTELLIKNGADVNALTKSERATPLIMACLYYNIEGIAMLIRNGANPNIALSNGDTAISILDRRKPGLYKDIEEEIKIIAADHMLFDDYGIFLDRETIEDMLKMGGKRKTYKKQKTKNKHRRKTQIRKSRKSRK